MTTRQRLGDLRLLFWFLALVGLAKNRCFVKVRQH
jgi:hypothetical protein